MNKLKNKIRNLIYKFKESYSKSNEIDKLDEKETVNLDTEPEITEEDEKIDKLNEKETVNLDTEPEITEEDEDLAILEMNEDLLKAKDYLSALVEQNDRIVYYEIENIYDNENKRTYKNKMSLYKQPPILIIKDNVGNEVEFFLTKNLTNELLHTLNEVKRAHLGFSGPIDIDRPDNLLGKIKYYIKNNIIKILFPIVMIIIIFILSITK